MNTTIASVAILIVIAYWRVRNIGHWPKRLSKLGVADNRSFSAQGATMLTPKDEAKNALLELFVKIRDADPLSTELIDELLSEAVDKIVQAAIEP